MRVEYMKNMLIDRLIGLDYIYTSDFITKMKNYISDEEDIEKLKDLDGFVTDRVYLDYFKDNIQEKLAEHSMSIFEVKNMIKNNSREVVGEKESVYSGRDFSYSGGFNSGVVEKGIVRVEVADTYKNDDSCEEDKEDEIDIGLFNKDSLDSDGFYENEEEDSEEDDIDIDLEEDDSEENDSEEDDSEEDDSEEDDEIDINLEDDEDDMDFDYEDNDFSGDDSNEDEIDIDLEEDDEDDIDLEDEDDSDDIDIDLEEDEDDIDIDLGEDDSDDIDIDLGDDEDIDVNLEDDEDDISTIHSNTPKPKENEQQHENRVKEKVFNNNFSNNTWDILNGAVDGVSNFFKRK